MDPCGFPYSSWIPLGPAGSCWILLDLVDLLDLLDLLNLLDPAGSWWILLDLAWSCRIPPDSGDFSCWILVDPAGSCWMDPKKSIGKLIRILRNQ